MKAAALPLTQTGGPVLPLSDRFAMSTVAVTALVVVAVVFIAFGLRVAHLSTFGFSEDEINKVRAVEQYRHGQLWANGEHPMLMKLAMLASVEAARAWNRFATVESAVPMETAIRLPNALVGAATAAALFGVCDVLFGTPVALMAALLWAFDVNAIAINRIGKEDTFALFFFLVAVWSYERAKRQGATDVGRRAALVHRQRRGVRPDARVEILSALPRHLRALQHGDRPRAWTEPARSAAVLRRDGHRVPGGQRRDPRSRRRGGTASTTCRAPRSSTTAIRLPAGCT